MKRYKSKDLALVALASKSYGYEGLEDLAKQEKIKRLMLFICGQLSSYIKTIRFFLCFFLLVKKTFYLGSLLFL